MRHSFGGPGAAFIVQPGLESGKRLAPCHSWLDCTRLTLSLYSSTQPAWCEAGAGALGGLRSMSLASLNMPDAPRIDLPASTLRKRPVGWNQDSKAGLVCTLISGLWHLRHISSASDCFFQWKATALIYCSRKLCSKGTKHGYMHCKEN
jgi:hypothetical protein